jgi:AraC family transcriptional regulator, regulatory protein of adaptative response / methylated-DNA-[protein]-cysteine methyltransferase
MSNPTAAVARAVRRSSPAAAQRASAVTADPRWAAVVARDHRADQRFVYSVRTTGVYCRPSCASRPAKPENVRFHATSDAAERAGFRPCKRCRPDQDAPAQQQARRIQRACRLIEAAEEPLTLEQLASQVNLSAYHFHRLFKQTTGVTPRAYAIAHRGRRVRSALRRGGAVTSAIADAGYNSHGRFYEEANGILGMTPRQFRKGGEDVDIRFAVGECSLGAVLVAMSARGVCAILLGDDADELARDLQDRFPRATLIGGERRFERMVAQVVGFIDDPRVGLDLPLDVRGTAFQQRVWQALRRIPPGGTCSYAQLARRIGSPAAVRAVAGACAANALAVAIPCHRVVRSDGALSGYRWGVERKRRLLAREAAGSAGAAAADA